MIETKKKSGSGNILTLFSERGKKMSRKIAALGLSALMAANTVLMAAPVSAAAATTAIDLEDGLIGYYPFENNELTNAVGDGSAALSGGAGATWDRPIGSASYQNGKNGQAYQFLGNSTTQTLVGTEWWTASQTGANYSLADGQTLTWTVRCAADIGGYAAFNVELVDGSGHYITTGSDGNAWYATVPAVTTGSEITGVTGAGSVIKGGVTYTITVKRSGQDFTITYYDETSKKQFAQYVAGKTNMDSNVSVHMIAQVGTFEVTNAEEVSGSGLKLDVTTGSDFTIGLWVNTQQKINYQPILFTLIDGDNYVTAGTQYNNFASGGIVNYKTIWYWLDKNNNSSSSLDDLPLDTWVYVTLTMTDNGVATLYYNGEVLSTQTIENYGSGYYANLPIYLGVNWWNESFKGLMDDVVVYDRALSKDEVTALYAQDGIPADIELSVTPSRVSVHDPSIIKDEETGMYYIFGSHLAWAKSSDLIHWETFANNINANYEELFKNEAEWAAMGDSNYTLAGNMWAPDVIWNDTMQKWCMYMSINGRSWDSCICLLTADSLDGDWTYVGPVIYSGFTEASYNHDYTKTDYQKVMGSGAALDDRYKMDPYTIKVTDIIDGKEVTSYTANTTWNRSYGAHAIDPCVLYDGGKLYMTYGSWSGGIYMIELDPANGLRNYSTTYAYVSGTSDPYMGYHLAGGSTVSGEASYIQKVGDYYYLYVTLGGLVATGGYNMRVFRSDKITGPYLDYSGTDAVKQTASYNSSVGNRVMSGYQWSYMSTGYVAQGHNSAFVDSDGKAFLIYHTRFNNGTEWHEVRVHQQFVNEDGWLVTAPFEYTGETLPAGNSITMDDVAGTYEVLFHKLDIDYANLEVVNGEELYLSSDGTVIGSHNGTWKFGEKGSPYVTLTLDGVTYKGVFVYQQMEESREKTWTFTVLGSDEISVWGYNMKEDLTDQEMADRAANALSLVEGTISDIELPVKGIYGADITWTSNKTDVLSAAGAVTQQEKDELVTLTATVKVGSATVTKTFEVTVYSKWVVHYEEFTELAGTTGSATGWVSPNASAKLSVKTDNDSHGYYLSYADPSDSGNRGAYTLFPAAANLSKNFMVEADIILNSGGDRDTIFAITDSSHTSNNGNNDITAGYYLKLTAGTGSTTCTVAGSNYSFALPKNTWIHISVSVDEDGNVTAKVGDKELTGTSTATAALGGMFLLNARSGSYSAVDNIIVHTHNWVLEEVTKQPTCTEEGEEVYICSVCGDIHTQAIETIPHEEGTVKRENVKAATCEEEGSYDEVTYCAVGGEVLTTVHKTTPALGHTPGAVEETDRVEPTEEDDGSYHRVIKCTVCGEILEDEVIKLPALKHNWDLDNGTIITEPTCTEEGWIRYECTDPDCDEVWEVPIDALGHEWDEGTVLVEVSCTQDGEVLHTCEVCGETKTVLIPILDHQEGEAVKENEEPATCTESGSYDLVVRCEVGGEIMSKEHIIAAPLGHQEAAAVKENVVEATCETDGSYEEVIYCSRCDEELSRVLKTIPALGHDWGEGIVTKAATCTEDGVRTYTCSNCGETKTEVIPALGHEWDEGTIKAATCTEDGKIVYHCTHSGCEETKEEVIPATGHSYGKPVFTWNSDDSATAAFTCEVCDDVQTVDATVTMTTTESGMIIYTASVEMDGETYTSKKQIIPLETDGDSDMRVVVADGFEEIPETLVKNDIKSEEDIETILKEELEEKGYVEQGYVEENFVLYDIVLQITTDQGESWKTVTAETFPEEGIMITIPYPEGTNGTDYDFVVTHMLTVAMNGYQPGDVEILDVTKTDAGLQFTVTSLSPIAVSWTELEPEDPAGTPEEPTTEDPAVTPEEPTTEDPAGTPEEPTTKDPATEDPKTQDPAVPASPVADGTDTSDDSEKNSNNSTSSPKTADSDRFVWTLLCGAFGGGLAGIAAKNRRKRNNAR